MAIGSFAKRREEAEKAGLLGKGEYLKLREGENRFRLLSECIPHSSTYQGKRNFKWLCYVIDRADGKVKPFFMPHKIYKQIEALQVSEDYGFQDVPLPYDLTLTAEKARTIDVVYTLMPARKETNLTDVEMHDFDSQKPIAELHKALLEKQTKNGGQSSPPPPSDDDLHSEPVYDPNDVPFAWLLPLLLPISLFGLGVLSWV